VDEAFALVRAVHLAATIAASGTVCFATVIAEPAIRQSSWRIRSSFCEKLFGGMRRLVRGSLILALLSGALWFLFVVGAIADRSPFDVFADDTAASVLIDTQFGRIWLMRLATGSLLFVAARFDLPDKAAVKRPGIRPALAACLLLSLAWTGHAGATVGLAGDLHLLSDISHLAAAGAWVGGLVPLAMLLAAARRHDNSAAGTLIKIAVGRFSVLGIVSVAAIVVTGIVNTCALVGGVAAFYGTAYGRLLMLKMALVFVMVSIAAVNRLWLSPQLPAKRPASKLQRNCWIEAVLGLAVIGIVGMLTLLSPAAPIYAGHTHSEHMETHESN
jgi:putative copper resistance protein D